MKHACNYIIIRVRGEDRTSHHERASMNVDMMQKRNAAEVNIYIDDNRSEGSVHLPNNGQIIYGDLEDMEIYFRDLADRIAEKAEMLRLTGNYVNNIATSYGGFEIGHLLNAERLENMSSFFCCGGDYYHASNCPAE